MPYSWRIYGSIKSWRKRADVLWQRRYSALLLQNKPIEPYRVFVSGPGGVGKSHVIRLIQSDTLKLLRLSGTVQPDDVLVLLTAPTGVAAFLINGMTLHSALLLGRGKYGKFQPLNHDRLNSLRSKLSNLVLLIIDKVSMVGSNMLLEIHKRLQQIKAVLPDVMFGGISILAVGNLYQLPPVGQSPKGKGWFPESLGDKANYMYADVASLNPEPLVELN